MRITRLDECGHQVLDPARRFETDQAGKAWPHHDQQSRGQRKRYIAGDRAHRSCPWHLVHRHWAVPSTDSGRWSWTKSLHGMGRPKSQPVAFW